MTDIEIAWLAGILEGEGCFTLNRTPKITLSINTRKNATLIKPLPKEE